MSISIYDKGKVIVKDNVKTYILKCGSKNCFSLPYQWTVDNNLHDKYMRGQTRESDWSIVAKGNGRLADTYLNCPTGHVYGKIRFGNKTNMALSFDKMKPTAYEDLDEEQKRNFDRLSGMYINHEWIDLDNIQDKWKFEPVHNYCGTEFVMTDENSKEYKGKKYWNLHNL
jgi:hypothetical protein